MEDEQFAMTYRGYRVSLGVTWAAVDGHRGYRGNYAVHGLQSADGYRARHLCSPLLSDFDLALNAASLEAQSLIDRALSASH